MGYWTNSKTSVAICRGAVRTFEYKKDTPLEVHIGPPERTEFSSVLSHKRSEHEGQGVLVAFPFGFFNDPSDEIDGRGAEPTLRNQWGFRPIGYIVADPSPPNSLVERRREDGLDLRNRLRQPPGVLHAAVEVVEMLGG